MQIDLIRPRSDSEWATLEAEWRALEAQADGSFFQSWTWVGCRARERFTDPFLFRASDAGQVAGLALFNRASPPLLRVLLPTLRLAETGRPAEDSVFIEHNGPLLARGRPDLLRPMLAAALRHGRLVLGGVSDEVRDAAASVGRCHVTATRPAPFATLAGMTEAGWLAGLGGSTRYQLRRSRRHYETLGPLTMHRAADLPEGLAFLAALATLHQARWVARGEPGAFAEPAFMEFHRVLVARGLPRGEVDLLRISAVGPDEARVIGYLYNFRWRDRVYAYQGGFDYAAAGPHQSPGLTCHHMAIGAAIEAGCGVYDFLAGEARYKTSLASAETPMHWIEVTSGRSLHDVWIGARSVLRSTGLKRLRPRVAAAGELPWPMAAAVILAWSLVAWVGIAYLIGHIR